MSRRRTGIGIAVLCLILALAGRWLWLHFRPQGRAAPATIDRSVVARAVVEPTDGVALVRPRVEGTVLRVLVRPGDTVKKGDLLAEIEPEGRAAELARSEAEVAVAEASAASVREGSRPEARLAAAGEVRAAEQQRALVADRAERARKLSASGSIPEFEVVAAERELSIADAHVLTARANAKLTMGGKPSEIAAATARARAASASEHLAREMVERGRMMAPIDGVILDRRVNPGDTVTTAMGLAEPAFELAATAHLEVRIEVEAGDEGALAPGQRVAFSLEGRFETVVQSVLGRVSPRMQRRSIGLEDSKARGDGFVRSAWATVAPADHAVLRVGQRLEARIFVGQAKVAVAVPRSAIQIRNGRSVVDVPFGPLLLERSVAIDTVDEDWVAVVGLAPATRVLLHPR